MNAPRELPGVRDRLARGGSAIVQVPVTVEVVTPILGGGTRARELDTVDVIRAATVRGHLRFWWRALRGHEFASPQELYRAESDLWGHAATDQGGRSVVQVGVEVQRVAESDDTDVHPQRTPGGYALWPARAEKERGQTKTPPAPRRKPGTRFRLTLAAPADREAELRSVVRAWLLFGGYGGRTRRGLGGFKVGGDAGAWLPAHATPEALTALFGRDVLAPPGKAALDVAWLAGAALHLGQPHQDPLTAWTTALDWLKDFRQGTDGGSAHRAREPCIGKAGPHRPSVSNWPEADKVRHLTRKTKGHRPRHNATPAWPRAGFGLPIIGRFQKNARKGGRLDEPDGFELRWRSDDEEHDRLASPLIVKALPLADGTFVPCALWLNRAHPDGGEVGLARPKRGGRRNEKEVDPRTVAPFDRLVAPGDTQQFSALANKPSLREAFLDWLHAKYRTTVVAL